MFEIVERWPKNIWGYIALADVYGHLFYRGKSLPYDELKANEWLDNALDNCELEEYDAEMIKERRESYKSNTDKK